MSFYFAKLLKLSHRSEMSDTWYNRWRYDDLKTFETFKTFNKLKSFKLIILVLWKNLNFFTSEFRKWIWYYYLLNRKFFLYCGKRKQRNMWTQITSITNIIFWYQIFCLVFKWFFSYDFLLFNIWPYQILIFCRSFADHDKQK